MSIFFASPKGKVVTTHQDKRKHILSSLYDPKRVFQIKLEVVIDGVQIKPEIASVHSQKPSRREKCSPLSKGIT